MQEKNRVELEFLPLQGISPEDIAMLNISRQKILTKLCFEAKTLSRIAEDIQLQPSSAFESLELLENKGFVKKDKNKVYSLTRQGKMLSFLLLKPNGVSEQQIQGLFDKFLKDEVGIGEADNREEIIEQRVMSI